jgi:threonine dehydrogenase-like Zn-dependent dehydrogenase
MKAAVYRRYGPPDVVTVEDVPEPVPGDDEVLVRVGAATVGVVDGLARRGVPYYARVQFGLRRPRFPVLGCDFAGEIAAVGPAVSRFGVGDRVFGTIAPRFGVHAEYVCLPEQGAVAAMPDGLGYPEAAGLVRELGGGAGARHRRVLPAAADRRGVPARRRGAQDGQRDRRDQLLETFSQISAPIPRDAEAPRVVRGKKGVIVRSGPGGLWPRRLP